MKRVLMLLMCVFSLNMSSSAHMSDKPIQVNQLPKAAQTFIKKHFLNHQVALAKLDSDLFDKSYDVIFTNGDKVEFDKNGNWKEVKCVSGGQVPSLIIPARIQAYVTKSYTGVVVEEIELDGKGYEVKLSNRLELKFDKQFNLIDIDK